MTLLSSAVTQAAACESESNIKNCVNVSVHDKAGNSVPDVVVYLLPLAGQTLTQTSEIVTISQNKKAFTPYITVSQSGNKVSFENQDDITHHIYSAGNHNKFSFKMKSGDVHLSEPFNNATEIAMGCNIHDWMSGSLLIVDTPYFSKTDKNGLASFSLEQLGQYQIVVWHPQLPTKDNRVRQEYQVTANADFNIVLPKNLESIPTQSSNDDFDFVSDY